MNDEMMRMLLALGGWGMDPVTLIVTALAAGAASALQDDAKGAVKAAYARLRMALKRRFAGRAIGEMALEQHEKAPDVWEKPLEAELMATSAATDGDLIAAAQELMKLLDAAGSHAGKYNVNIQNFAIRDGFYAGRDININQ